jgi:dTDP-4-dehydrorhamnose reductase
MVFHHDPDGPHNPDDNRNAIDDYGKYKILCENAVLAANPGACIARIGWQIDPHQKGNNMLMALDSWQSKDGEVSASRAWSPACSFMEDTAASLVEMLRAQEQGVFHLDSNADEGHRFDEIVIAMQSAFQRESWMVRVHDQYRHDQRLVGGRKHLPPLSARLPL